jgi:hypothetical protein
MANDISADSYALSRTEVAQDLARRVLVGLGLIGIALIHLLDAKSKLEETPYLGVGYILIIIAALGAAEALIRRSTPLRWAAAGLVALAPLIGYILSRTTGLPSSTDDIGNWWEPLGVASLFVEGTVVILVILGMIGVGVSPTPAKDSRSGRISVSAK